jgi:hypothetical protein
MAENFKTSTTSIRDHRRERLSRSAPYYRPSKDNIIGHFPTHDEETTDAEPVVSNPLLIASGLFGIPELTSIPMALIREICAEYPPFDFEEEETTDAEPVVSNPRLIASGLSDIPELADIPMDLLDEICAEYPPFNDEDEDEDEWEELFAMADAWGATATC